LVNKFQAVNVGSLDKDIRVENGSTITMEQLVIRGYAGKNDSVKILGNGEITKKLTFSGITAFAESAKEKITAVGGTIA
jgi:large subunit ribosomal protein L15